MHHPADRIGHTTTFVTPVEEYWLEKEIILTKYKMQVWHIESAGEGDGMTQTPQTATVTLKP